MANLNRRKNATHSISFKITQDFLNNELVKKENKDLQITGARQIRHNTFIPRVDREYKEVIATITSLFQDPDLDGGTASDLDPDGGAEFDPVLEWTGSKGSKTWKPLTPKYLARKSDKRFLHNRGGLNRGFGRLFPEPKGTVVRPRRGVKVYPASGGEFSAEVSVYITHKLGNESLTEYVNKAFTRGVIDASGFSGTIRTNVFKLAAFERGKRNRGGGRTPSRPFIGAVARNIGVYMRANQFRGRKF